MSDVTYTSLNYTDGSTVYSTYLTGIAGENIVGMYVTSDGDDHGFIYNDVTGTWIMIGYPGAYSTVPYGPTTGDASSSIIVVGSYKIGDSQADNGFIYNAATGTYTTIDMPGATDTIPHSTYGEYVVGNYDTLTTSNPDYAVYPSGGNAFIYDMDTQTFATLEIPDATSTTAYGIWDGVIAGGVDQTNNGIQISDAYLYDMASGDYYTYSYKNAVVTHFDGITGGSTAGSYIVTGDYLLKDGTEGAFSATITDFTNIVWTDLLVPGSATTSGNSGYQDTAVGVYLTSGSKIVTGYIATLPCFAAGTLITTPSGPVPVERLAAGMTVETRYGGTQPIHWVGHRRVDCARHPEPTKVWPVRVCAHAFGQNQPSRDLFLSPDHAVFVDDVLIPVKYLIDGDAICQIPAGRMTYYHVELAQHDVITAEGLAAESLLPREDRSAFDNGGGVTQIHPDFSHLQWDVVGCAPLVVTGPQLDAARTRLAASGKRAAA